MRVASQRAIGLSAASPARARPWKRDGRGLSTLNPKVARPRRLRGVDYAGFVMDGTGWRNASLSECLPSSGMRGLEDVTEEVGYGWRFFRDTARSRLRRAVLPVFAVVCAGLARIGRPPSLALPYLNLVFRKTRAR